MMTIFTYSYSIQAEVERQGEHIKALQEGLETRRRLTIAILAVSVVILVTVTVAFSIALSQKTSQTSLVESKVFAVRKDIEGKVVTKKDLEEVHTEIEEKVSSDLQKVKSEIEDIKNSVESLKTIIAEPETDRQIGYRYFKLPMKTLLFPGGNGPIGQAP